MFAFTAVALGIPDVQFKRRVSLYQIRSWSMVETGPLLVSGTNWAVGGLLILKYIGCVFIDVQLGEERSIFAAQGCITVIRRNQPQLGNTLAAVRTYTRNVRKTLRDI